MSGVDAEKLNIILAARDREFTAALDRNARRVERFAQRSQKGLSKTTRSFDVMGRAAKAAAPLLAALGAGAVINRLKATVASLDDIGKTADKIGLTTDALQELRVVAESAGVAQASLDSSMERFSKRLGEAALGSGAAAKALREMGLRASRLQEMVLDEALSRVADKIAAIPDPTERAARAAALFGREGVAMVNLLREGSEGMDRMRQEARELGVVIDESLVRSAEDAQTKLDLMSRVISANLASALINLAPLLVGAAQGVATLTTAVNEFLAVGYAQPELMDAEAMRAAAAEYGGLSKELAAMTHAQAAYNANVEKYGEGSAEVAKWAGELEVATRELNDALAARKLQEERTAAAVGAVNDLSADLRDAQERARLAGISAEEAERERISREKTAHINRILAADDAADRPLSDSELEDILSVADAFEAAEIAASKILNPVKAAGGATAEAKEEGQEYANVLARIAALTGLTGLESANFAQVMAEVDALFEQGKINGDEYAEMIGQIEEKFDAASAAANRLEGMFADTFASIITGSESVGDALSNLLAQLASMAAQAAFMGLFGGSGFFKAIAPVFDAGVSFNGGGYTGPGPRTGGVDGQGGFPAILHPQESVVDHTKGQTLGGGPTSMTISVHVSGARGNAEITEMVEAGVKRGLSNYDRQQLPASVKRISRDPRRMN